MKKWNMLTGAVLLMFALSSREAYAQNDLDTVYNDGTIEEFISQETLTTDLETVVRDGELSPEQKVIPDIPSDAKFISDREDMLPEINPEKIIGSDNRKIVSNTTINPYKKVAFLVITFPNGASYTGSGSLVSSDTVLTAGHCIYSKSNGGFAKSVSVYPGYNGTYAPYGVAYSKKIMTVRAWTDNESPEHDIGAIKLDRNLGNTVGWFGLTTNMIGPITLSGYHGDLERKMGTESGNILKTTSNNVYYTLDSERGSSGSGVYNNQQKILAVHAFGSTDYNFGTRINNEKFNIIKYWIDGATITYDKILERDKRDYSAIVKPVSESKGHGVTDDVNNTKPGINKLGTGDKYAGQKVRILEYAKTNRATYVKFSINGTVIGWMDQRAFRTTLDIVKISSTSFITDIKPSNESGSHGLYTLPNNTSENCKKIGVGSLYAGKVVNVLKTGVISTGATAYQFSIGGKVIGWLDSRAFKVYDKILERDKRDYSAIVKPVSESKGHGITDDVNNTKPGINRLGTGDKYAGRKVRILEYTKTNRATYVKFSINGTVIGWMDQRAFRTTLDTVKISGTSFITDIKPSNESGSHGLYTLPNNTSENCKKIGVGSLYAGKVVNVLKTGVISTGATAYQFSIDGKVIGWLDSRAFKVYDKILERDKRDYSAIVKPVSESKGHGITDDVNNTKPGINRLGTGDKYAGRKVRILEYTKTNRATYVKFSINGTVIGWMDQRAFI